MSPTPERTVKPSRRIKDYMTRSPRIVEARASIEEAQALMQDQALRHLPVLKDGKIVGILSDRDLAGVFGRRHAETLRVEEVMTPSPYFVDPDGDIQQIAQIMAANRLGSVLVKGPGEKLEGIFTTTNALELLARLFDAI